MKLGPSRRSSAVLPTMVALMIVAGVGFALAGQRVVHAPQHAVREGDHGGSQHGADGHGGGSGGSEAPGDGSAGVSEGCAAAVGTGQEAVDTGAGLAHAIEVLLENCERNPQAEGLLNALQRLQDNEGRPGGGEQGNAGGSSADHAPGSKTAYENGSDGGSRHPSMHPGLGDGHRSDRAGSGGSQGGEAQG